jgi:YYY domain-containing protein
MVLRLAGRLNGVALLILTAALLRLVGVNWGDGHPIHPDERHVVNMVSGLSWNDPNPHNFAYGSLPLYLLRAASRGCALAFGPWFESYAGFFLVGRLISSVASVLTVLLVLSLGTAAFGRRIGLEAAWFLSLCVLHIELAHYYTVESLLVLGVTATFWACVRIATRGRAADYLLAGILMGMSIATKLSALPLALLVLVAHLLGLVRRRRTLDSSWVLLAISFLAGYLSFYLCEPFAFAQFPFPWAYIRAAATSPLDPEYWVGLGRALFSHEFLRDFWEQSNMVRGISQPIYVAVYENTRPYLYQAEQLIAWGMGPPLGILCLLGVAYSTWLLARRTWVGGVQSESSHATHLIPVALLLAWLLSNGYLLGGFKVKFLRYLAPLLPFLCLAGAKLLGDLRESGNVRRQRIAHWVALAVLGYSLFYALAYSTIFFRPHTHTQASRWYAENARPDARVLQEHWDETLPYALPETPPFQGVEFPSYDPDSPSKLRTLSKLLAEGDYFIASSNRIYGTILRWQDRWPQTSRLYKRLFSGDLGFELVAHFASPPSLFGLTLDDRYADESFINYDHPTVLVFENRERLTTEAIAERVERPDPRLDPLSFRESVGLLSALPVAGPPGSPSNIAQALLWWLALSGLGWLVFPICFHAFSGMPDRGLGASKTLGLLLIGYIAWFTAMMGWTRFTRPWLVAIVLMVGLTSALLAQRSSRALLAYLRANIPQILLLEALFLGVGGVFLCIRAWNPEIYWGEKPMDFSFLNSFLRTESFPPAEPWFAGALLNYYYFGFVIVAAAGKLTGVAPGVLYNLAVATIPAQVFVLALAVAQTVNRRVWFAVLAAVLVVFMGNLAWVAETYFVAAPRGGFDLYWATSRVIPGAAIEEYPLWTFLFADLHAHMMAMPAALLTLFCGLSVLGARDGSTIGGVALGALALGSLFVTNTWDFISYTLIVGGLAVGIELARRRLESGERGPDIVLTALVKGGGLALALALGGLALFYPFFSVFSAGATYHGPNRDGFVDLRDLMLLFGQFLWIHWSSLLLVHRSSMMTRPGASSRRLYAATLLWGASVLIVLVLELGGASYVTAIASISLAAIAAMTAVAAEFKPRFVAGWLLLALGCTLVGLAELYTIADRMNTLFKAYNAVWYLLALSAAASIYRGLIAIWEVLSDPVRARYGRRFVFGSLAWLAAAAGILIVAGVTLRVNVAGVIEPQRVPVVRPTIDGTAYLRGKFPADSRGIEWLNRSVRGQATVLEAWGPSYQDFTRVCMHTGLNTVLGWEYHVLQRGQSDAEIRARQRDIATAYRSENPMETRAILDRYRVDYVFVGDLEARTYGRAVLERFDRVPGVEPVFSHDQTRIYRVHGALESGRPEQVAWTQRTPSQTAVLLPPTSPGLRHIGALAVGPGDRLHALNWRTGQVEVFSRRGEHVLSFRDLLRSHGANLHSLWVGSDGRVLGADAWTHRILELDPAGNTVRELDTPMGLRRPSAVITDEVGRVWIADTGNDRVLCLGPPVLEVARTGKGPLRSPVALAVEPGGTILVLCDELRGVFRIDAEGSCREVFRLPPGAPSLLDQYAGLAIDPEGAILVSHPTAGAVYRFDSESGLNPVPGGPTVPTGLATDSLGNLYVGDGIEGGVHLLAKQLRHNVFEGGQGTDPGFLDQPRGVAWHADGTFWVADFDNHRVQKLRRDGRVVLTSGEEGELEGEFRQPCDLATLPDGGVAVADTWNHRIQILDPRGRVLRVFGQFYGPRGIALGPDGLLYVTDTGNAMVKVFRLEGEPVRQWGGRGSAPGLLDSPVGIVVTQDRVFVADVNNGRVQEFSLEGRWIASIPVPAWRGSGSEPHLAIDAKGRLLATVPTENRIVLLDRDLGEIASFRGTELGDGGLLGPTGLDVRGEEVLVSDTWNHRIQRLMNPFP